MWNKNTLKLKDLLDRQPQINSDFEEAQKDVNNKIIEILFFLDSTIENKYLNIKSLKLKSIFKKLESKLPLNLELKLLWKKNEFNDIIGLILNDKENYWDNKNDYLSKLVFRDWKDIWKDESSSELEDSFEDWKEPWINESDSELELSSEDFKNDNNDILGLIFEDRKSSWKNESDNISRFHLDNCKS